MKVIDLLNKIANEEEIPQFIKYEDKRYFWTGLNYYNDRYDEYLDNHICIEDLEQYIEIIEEDKKIEKLIPTSLRGIDNLDEKIEIAHIDTISAIDKINEIIDYINGGTNE